MAARQISSFPILNNTDGNIKILVTYNSQTYLLRLAEVKGLISKDGIGLSNVDNTSDLDKPLSDAAIIALTGKAELHHTHTVDEITGLSDLVDSIIMGGIPVSVVQW